jgi:hypothetical protein
MPKSTRSVAIELHENAAAIEQWRSTLSERQRRRLIHPLSNVRRWRASIDFGRPGRRKAATSQWGFRLIEVLSGVPDAALLLDVRGTRAVKFVLVIFGILSASAAQAQNAPWCLQSSALDGSLRCTYATFEQCLVDRQAKNGFCTQNSTYQASSPSIRRR